MEVQTQKSTGGERQRVVLGQTKIERDKSESSTRRGMWAKERPWKGRIEEEGAGAAVSSAVRCCQDDEWEASVGCEGSDGSR